MLDDMPGKIQMLLVKAALHSECDSQVPCLNKITPISGANSWCRGSRSGFWCWHDWMLPPAVAQRLRFLKTWPNSPLGTLVTHIVTIYKYSYF